jgi:hypothetical protein
VPVDLIDPVPLGLIEDARFECFSMKLVHFDVVERAPPLVCHGHVVILVAFTGPFRPGSAPTKKCVVRGRSRTLGHGGSSHGGRSSARLGLLMKHGSLDSATRASFRSELFPQPHTVKEALFGSNNLVGNALSVAALQVERARVDAVPLAGWLGAVVEEVPQVGAARRARHLDPVHEEAGVVVELHGVG